MSTELQSPPQPPETTDVAIPHTQVRDASGLLPAVESLVRSRAIELHANALSPGKALLLIREEVLGALGSDRDPAVVKTVLRRVVEVIFETYRHDS